MLRDTAKNTDRSKTILIQVAYFSVRDSVLYTWACREWCSCHMIINRIDNIDGLTQDCSNPYANALELLQYVVLC